MSLQQFLAQLQQKEMGNQAMPSQVPPDIMNGIDPRSIAMPQRTMSQQTMQQAQDVLPQQQLRDPMQPKQRKGDSGIRSFLGNLGDALLIGSGADPIYKPSVEKREMGEVVAQYLGQIDPRLADVARRDPAMGVQFMKMLREDQRFDRTAGQDDRRIDVSEGQLDLGTAELGERVRSNRASEGLTERGQTLSATTQIRLQNLRSQEAAAGRAFAAAMKSGDRAHAEKMLGLQQSFQREIATLKGDGPAGKVTETIEEPARTEGGFMGIGGTKTPAKKIVTERPLNASSGPSQADLEFTAKKYGITVEEVKRRLGGN